MTSTSMFSALAIGGLMTFGLLMTSPAFAQNAPAKTAEAQVPLRHGIS